MSLAFQYYVIGMFLIKYFFNAINLFLRDAIVLSMSYDVSERFYILLKSF